VVSVDGVRRSMVVTFVMTTARKKAVGELTRDYKRSVSTH